MSDLQRNRLLHASCKPATLLQAIPGKWSNMFSFDSMWHHQFSRSLDIKGGLTAHADDAAADQAWSQLAVRFAVSFRQRLCPKTHDLRSV